MAKFPTEVEHSETMRVPIERAYAFLWDVARSARCIPGIERCDTLGSDTYHFVYAPRSTGPVTVVVRYTARYEGNGRDEIRYRGIAAADDNTDVEGLIRLEERSDGTRVVLRQMLAPETPVPWLLQGLIRSFAQREADEGVATYLANVRAELE